MAHFSELDAQNIVIKVIVVNNTELLDQHGSEQEILGASFCQHLLGGRWVQTSYNSSFRKNFAVSGFFYDEGRDAFVPPQTYASWILNEETCRWEAPILAPDNDRKYAWNETTTSWDEVI